MPASLCQPGCGILAAGSTLVGGSTLALPVAHVAPLTIQAEAIFGQRTGLAGLRPEYSPGEPAVNIYTAGGEFAPHTDKQSVSLLVPL